MTSKTKVEIRKVELLDGEEMHQFGSKVAKAVRAIMDNAYLYGIYKDHVILREWRTGNFIRMDLRREGEGVQLSNSQKVRQTFVPISSSVKKSDKGEMRTIQIPSMLLLAEGDQLSESSIAELQNIAKSAETIEGVSGFVELKEDKAFWGNLID